MITETREEMEKKLTDLMEDAFDIMDQEEEEEEEAAIVTLTDDYGNEIPFELLDQIPYQGKTYVVLLPVEEEDSDTVAILELTAEDEETESYIGVDNEEILKAVFDLFKERNQEFFDFI